MRISDWSSDVCSSDLLPARTSTGRRAAQFTASFSALPALKAGFFAAAIWISSPVRGLRPVRAARARTSKVPKPIRLTLSPAFRAPVIEPTTASSARPASALDRPELAAKRSEEHQSELQSLQRISHAGFVLNK